MNANLCCLSFWLCVLVPTWAQQTLPAEFRLTGKQVTAAFEPQREVLQSSSAVLLQGRRAIGYAVVATADGHLLAKASEVAKAGKLSARIGATLYPEVERLAEDSVWDVVLLKVSAAGLVPVRFAQAGPPAQGSWVICNGATTRSERRALAGIISAQPRDIPAAEGVALGLEFKDESTLIIAAVADGGGAKAAGIQVGDVVVSLNEQPVTTLKALVEALKPHQAGSKVRLSFLRKGQRQTVEVQLTAKAELFANGMQDRNDQMSGDVSKRRSGFPAIIQHDALTSARTVGGPLLDLDGQCVGMNIARANRCETYAIPAAELQKLLESLLKQAAASGPRAE